MAEAGARLGRESKFSFLSFSYYWFLKQLGLHKFKVRLQLESPPGCGSNCNCNGDSSTPFSFKG